MSNRNVKNIGVSNRDQNLAENCQNVNKMSKKTIHVKRYQNRSRYQEEFK